MTQLQQIASLFNLTYQEVDSSMSWEGLPTKLHCFLHTSKNEYGCLHFASLTFIETEGYFTILNGTPEVFSMKADAGDKVRQWCKLLNIQEGETE